MPYKVMTIKPFAPKDAEQIKSEITTELGMDYEGNEEMIDRLIAKGLKDEEFKASLHQDKMDAREKLKDTRKLAGLDPETGEKIVTKVTEEPKGSDIKDGSNLEQILEARALNDVHEDDIEEVAKLAKLKGVSLREIKKDPYIQVYLKTRAEERQTAEATSTGNARKTASSNNLLKKVENADENMSGDDMKSAARQIVEEMRKG